MREFGQGPVGNKKMEFGRQGAVFDESGACREMDMSLAQVPVSDKYDLGPMYLFEDRRYSLTIDATDNWTDSQENMEVVKKSLAWKVVDENMEPH